MRLLIPLDGSLVAEEALAPAAAIARAISTPTTLILLRCASSPTLSSLIDSDDLVPAQGSLQKEITRDTAYLAEIAARPLLSALVVEQRIINGTPQTVICQEANEQHADLIIGPRWYRRMLDTEVKEPFSGFLRLDLSKRIETRERKNL